MPTVRKSEKRIADIIEGLHGGLTMNQASNAAGVHPNTLLAWCREDPALRARVYGAVGKEVRGYVGQLREVVEGALGAKDFGPATGALRILLARLERTEALEAEAETQADQMERIKKIQDSAFGDYDGPTRV